MAEKDLGVVVGKKLIMNQQCSFAAKAVNCILGCVRRRVASKLKEVTILLYSALVRDSNSLVAPQPGMWSFGLTSKRKT